MCIGVLGPAEEANFLAAARGAGTDVIEPPRALEREVAPVVPEPRPTSSPLLLTRDEAAALLGISGAHLARLHNTGAILGPHHLGRIVRYSKAELEAWVKAGLPPRREWERMKKRDAKKG